MYIWSTEKLADDIKNKLVSDNAWMRYFMAWTMISTLSMYLMSVSPYEDTNAMLVEMIAVIGIVIFGVSITFQTNLKGGGTAENYFSRSIALSVPLIVKLFVLSLLVGLFLSVTADALSLPAYGGNWVMCGFAIIVQALYFWRINVHLQHINT